MSSPSRSSMGSTFVELARGRCEELLAQQSVGRVAWNAADGPQVLPVNYAWHVGQVVFRTAPYGVISTLARRTPVAFEVDHIEEEQRAGWSVVVRGFAEAVIHDQQLVRLWSSDVVVPWATGTRTLFIAITPRTISGRSVQAW